MKLLFFSDVHGGVDALKLLFQRADELKPDVLVLLGDILYGYGRQDTAKRTAALLNSRKDSILAVRGNCDDEDDQRLLSFPMLDDYREIVVSGKRFFLTHGHIWNERNLPTVEPGTVLVHGHTHVPKLEDLGYGITVFNPGSITMPREGRPPTFGFYDGQSLSLRYLDDGTFYL